MVRRGTFNWLRGLQIELAGGEQSLGQKDKAGFCEGWCMAEGKQPSGGGGELYSSEIAV